MKKKIVATLIIFILLFTNYVIAVDYSRTGGSNVNSIAQIITADTYIDGKYNAYSKDIPTSNVKVYNYNTNVEKSFSGNYSVSIGENTHTLNNVATIIYKDAIVYDGNTYNVKVNINQIKKPGSEAMVVDFDTNSHPDSLYIHRRSEGTQSHVEVLMDYYIVDDEGNEQVISGLLNINDVDLSQGVAVGNYIATSSNLFATKSVDSTVKYKVMELEDGNQGTYFYSTAGTTNLNREDCTMYALITDRSRIGLTATFEHSCEIWFSFVNQNQDIIKRYKKITTNVINGNITDSIADIKDGESRTIEYEPNYDETQYLKSVKVDGVEQSVSTYPNEYLFSNITEDHTIVVEYANKYKVEFNAKGGTPTPNTQYVMPDGKATQPQTNPTKTGYTFKEWVDNQNNEPYDFDTLVNEDKLLNATWNPISYRINYVLNGGTNDPNNPSTYTIEDTIDFQPAEKPGYVFRGWYEDEDFRTPIAGISNRTGDVTVYAKWEARDDVEYKVEHYKKNNSGTYDLATRETLTGTVNETVTASPKTYAGYSENTEYDGRVPSGVIKADGSLVLKLYYDPIVYRINYVLNGGENDPSNPDTYTVEDEINFKVATRDGYDFLGWYEDEEFTEELPGFENRTGDITVYAKWKSKNDTEYKVEHYKKDKDGKYKLAQVEKLTGKTDEVVTARPKNYDSFDENTNYSERIPEGTIKADGSLVLKLYYDPIIYKITYVPNGGTNSPDNPSTYRAGDIIDFQPAEREGFDFVGWYEDENFENKLDSTAGKTGDLKVYAKWKAKKDIEYKVEHYKEQDDGKYKLVVTDTFAGTMDTEVTAVPKKFEGYKENKEHENRIEKGTIRADGSLVLKLYYDKIENNNETKDDTMANDPIPQTGESNLVIVFTIIIVLGLALVFGIKYFKFRNIE